MKLIPRFCAVFAAILALCLPAVVAITLQDAAARFGLKLKPAGQAAASAARGSAQGAPLPFQQKAAAIAARHQGNEPAVPKNSEKKSIAPAAFGSALKPVNKAERPKILEDSPEQKFANAFKKEWLAAVEERKKNPQVFNSDQEMAYQSTKAAIAQLDMKEIQRLVEESRKQAMSIKSAQEKFSPQRQAMQQEFMARVGGQMPAPRPGSPRPQVSGIPKGAVAKAKGKFQ